MMSCGLARENDIILAYLAQEDNRLGPIGFNFTSRNDVKNYPTDFKAMIATHMNLLIQIGYALTST